MFGWKACSHPHPPTGARPEARTRRFPRTAALALSLGLALAPAFLAPGLAPARAQGSEEAPAASGRPLTLDQAIALALDQGPDRRAADLELELARLEHAEAQAEHLVNPSPVSASQAESAWRIAQAEHEASARSIALSVEEAYYDLIRSLQQVELSRGNLEQVRGQLEAAQVRYEAGALAELDLRQTRQQVAQAENQLEQDRRSVEAARRTLNRLLGLPLETELELAETELIFTPVEPDLEEALASALENRLEVVQARDRVETARINLELVENPYTARLTQERRRLELRQAEEALEQARVQVELEVRQAYDALLAAQALVPLRQEAAELAAEQLRIAELRFEAGTITSLDVTDAQQAAFEAQVASLNAVFDYRIRLAQFYQAARLPNPERAPVTN